MRGNSRDSVMAVTTGGGTRSLTRGVMFYRHLSIHRRVTPVVVITDMKKCETPQILHHQIKCCEDLIVLKTNIVTAQVTVRPKMCIFTELERGMVGPVTLHKKIHTTTVLFIVQIHILLIQAIIQAKLQMQEQRQKEANKMAVNSFPKDRDYRREVMQATATSGFASGMEDKHSSDASSLLPQNILSQTSRHNDRDYRLPRAETHSSSTPVQHPIKPVVHPTATPSTVPSSPFTLQSDHQPKKSFDANGASTLSKLPTPTSSVPAQKTERKESTSGDKSVSHSCTTPSTSSASGLNPTSAPPTSASAIPVSPVPQSPIPPLLQDPNLLRQLLPALQATLQLNNSNVDISKINEVLTAAVTQASLQSIIHKFLTAGPSAFNLTSLISQAAQLSTQAQPSNQSPMSLTSDASSPRSYVSPRISTPQTNTVPIKPLISTPPVSSQPKVSTPVVKQGPVSQSATQQPITADKQQGHEPVSPRSLQRSNSQRSPSPGPNHTSSSNASNAAVVPQNSSARPACALTPTLAAHFNENLIKHVQGWPADHAEKQASRLREEAHNMGSVHMSEICTELKNLRSLVRVCEIQATLREQRILFLRQQIKELEKLKNQNSFMV
ncbi:WW domain-containing adapter protein with coiled-coil isoform X4 [Vicugna pacos]|uniref:WW domain-containing adapter protein with coiled-coil isoform X4 n=3 Tax=Vicugna pacos TaxID=30538 RepID=A0ABM5CRV0_VICPA